MKVAITGATGFIGRHVINELARYDVEIIAIAKQPITIHHFPKKIKVVHLDLKDTSSNTFKHIGNPDVLIHLAWGGLPNYNSLHHFEQELPMHYNFLQKMIKSGLSSLFVTGTCFEYGMRSGLLREDMKTYPNNPYGFAKDVLRKQLEYLRAVNSFSMTWGRLFYLYGNGQSENSILPQLRRAVEREDKVFNMSGGEQLRDYISAANAAKYIVSLALQRKNIGTVNVCSGKPVSIRRKVEGWITENDWHIKLNLAHYPYPENEPMAFWGDQHKLTHSMGSL